MASLQDPLGIPEVMMHSLKSVPAWRNWQTRRTQNPVPLKSVGSNPTAGTTYP